MAIERGTGSTTAYYANRTAPRARTYPLSAKQAAWLPALQDEAASLARSAYALQIDMLMLARGEHTDATRADAVAAVQTVQNDMIRGIRAYRAETMHSGEFSLLIATRDGLRVLDRRNRAALASILGTRVRTAPTAASAVPEGCYAVDYQGVLRFYRVKHGTGRWDGRTFLNRFRSDDETRVSRQESTASLAAIATDIPGARERFARESQHCWMCGRRLTDIPGAMARGGIGPECAKK